MLIQADRILQSLVSEFDKLMPSIADSDTDGSSTQAIAHALRLLQGRAAGGTNFVHGQFVRLSQTLEHAATVLQSASDKDILSTMVADLNRIVARAHAPQRLEELEALWLAVVASLQALIVRINRATLPAEQRRQLLDLLSAWEIRDLRSQVPVEPPPPNDARNTPITVANLTAYLRDRFAAPDLVVTKLDALAGGFGKQTTIFAVTGSALSGDYVIRRDVGADVGIDNDCHRIKQEYQVIRAAHRRGFPAPDVMWLDTEHGSLPGGDFIVMRRAPGIMGGNFFGAQTAVPPDLADVLAERMAQLHNFPPLLELGDLTDSIRTELWNIPVAECIRRYITNWYELYLADEHTPSPATVALYGWLLDNVPARIGLPTLLHGDIGFHNMLFYDGGMSVLVDWEFAHIGDPAEDLGYVKVTVGHSLDWDRFMARYEAAGGRAVDARTLHYFQVWALVRNATAANISSTRLVTGRAHDLKLTILPYVHIPNFIEAAEALIAAGP